MNPLTAEPYCGCDPLLLRQYYYPPLKLCYEHLTRGPCEAGLLFAYNHTGDATQCLCNPSILNYNFDTGQCFQFDTKGPCRKGQMYQYSKMTGSGQCLCRKGYVYWPLNGECYKAFTSGPCRPGQFLIPHEQDETMGQCVVNPCPRAHLYFESGFDTEVKCHKVCHPDDVTTDVKMILRSIIYSILFSRLAVEVRVHLVNWLSLKSTRGNHIEVNVDAVQDIIKIIGLRQDNVMNGILRDLAKTRFCSNTTEKLVRTSFFIFVMLVTKLEFFIGGTECVCDEEEGFVFWNETGKCYRVYTQGPCPDNAWLIPADDLTEVFCECQAGYHFSPTQYACRRSPLVKPLIRRTGNPGLHLLLKNHKMYSAAPSSTGSDYEEDEIENATDEPTLSLRGVFINPDTGQDTARIDTGTSSITDKFSWLKNRHKWDWWQKARQPRQPWQSSNRRRRRRRRRLVH